MLFFNESINQNSRVGAFLFSNNSELRSGITLYVGISSQIWDINIRIFPLKNGSRVVHGAELVKNLVRVCKK